MRTYTLPLRVNVCALPGAEAEQEQSSSMAIYHLSVQTIGRSSGRSSVAACAYRHGARMIDERTGLVHDYTRKAGVAETVMLLPEGAPTWASDPVQLWNRVEANEKRKDAQTAREMNIALPVELNPGERRALVLDFCREQFTDAGMVADVAFHDPDENNPHAHIMLTMRRFDGDGFGPKAREWNDKATLEQWRGQWEEHTNRALEQAGHEVRIDHRSLEAQAVAAVIDGNEAVAIRLSREAQRHHGGQQGADIGQINAEVAEGMAEAMRRAAEWEKAHAAEVAQQQEQARQDRRAAQQSTPVKPSPTVERDTAEEVEVKAAAEFLKKREREAVDAGKLAGKAGRVADAWAEAVKKRSHERWQADEAWTKAADGEQAHQRRLMTRLGLGGRESKRLEEETARKRVEYEKKVKREREAIAMVVKATAWRREAWAAHGRAVGGVERGQQRLAAAKEAARWAGMTDDERIRERRAHLKANEATQQQQERARAYTPGPDDYSRSRGPSL